MRQRSYKKTSTAKAHLAEYFILFYFFFFISLSVYSVTQRPNINTRKDRNEANKHTQRRQNMATCIICPLIHNHHHHHHNQQQQQQQQ
jgi:hypothetical protein